MNPYYTDELAELWHHDARRVSDIIEPQTVDLIVTSPPYFALRSYRDGGEHYDGQIGSEATPREFIEALMECTRDWITVLKPTGSMFVNLGDKRAGAGPQNAPGRLSSVGNSWHWQQVGKCGIPAKSRMLLPERFAIACVDEGLLARQVIIWSKVNVLPEPVTDRCRDSHEYIYHLTKQGRYYAAIDEVREPQTEPARSGTFNGNPTTDRSDGISRNRGWQAGQLDFNPLGKVPGSVWTIPSEPLTVPKHLGIDHFAAFPSELPRRCILGWTPPGWCLECGEPRRPVVEKGARFDLEAYSYRAGKHNTDRTDGALINNVGGVEYNAWRAQHPHLLTGYACACPTPDAPTRPAVVLDPFAGTGTTIAVAKALGRRGIGIDLSRDYLRLAEWRINHDPLRRRILERTGIPVPRPPAHEGQEVLFT